MVEYKNLTNEDPKEDLISIKESNLQGHLNNANNSEADVKNQPENNVANNKFNKDYQLHEALMVLKAMSVLQK